MKHNLLAIALLICVCGTDSVGLSADAVERTRASHVERFELTEKPSAERDGDRITIRFAVSDFCDATVAAEDAGGRIYRHLASGVLGDNAPPPFARNSKRQQIVWDCKDDRGEYVRDSKMVIRVSLGLQARFERTLYWSPYKLGQNGEQPSFCVAPEGVYVYGAGVGRASLTPWLRLFDHAGKYLRTLFPFPAGQLEQVAGLEWKSYPPDAPGRKFAVKGPPEAQTSHFPWPGLPGEILRAGDVRPVMASDNDYVYLLGPMAVRIAKPSSKKPSSLQGPQVVVTITQGTRSVRYYPASAALSPDGKWLYLAGYSAFYGKDEGHGWLHFLPCVMRMPADCSKPPEPLIGVATPDAKDSALACPSGVACDRAGRLYVTDFTEGLLIFSPDGKLLHQDKLDTPGSVAVAPETGDIWVAGWPLNGAYGGPRTGQTPQTRDNVVLYRLTPYAADNPPKIAESFVVCRDMRDNKVHPFNVAMDFAGMLYLRTESIIARYDPRTWREVLFDYGLELNPVTHYGLKPAQTVSSPYFKGGRGASGKIFGMGVNARGDVAVSFYWTDVSSVEMAVDNNPEIKRPDINVAAKGVKPWKPRVYPGRSTYAFIHIWDRHGKLKFEDAGGLRARWWR